MKQRGGNAQTIESDQTGKKKERERITKKDKMTKFMQIIRLEIQTRSDEYSMNGCKNNWLPLKARRFVAE